MHLRLRVRPYDLSLLGERGEEIIKGELAHRSLYFLDPLPADKYYKFLKSHVTQAVERALSLAHTHDPRLHRRETLRHKLIDLLTRALALKEVRPFFIQEVSYEAELEVLDEKGHLHRLDRLVYTSQGPVLLEFKLGTRRRAHWEQVRSYSTLLTKVLGKRPKTYLFYLEEPSLIEVTRPCQVPLF